MCRLGLRPKAASWCIMALAIGLPRSRLRMDDKWFQARIEAKIEQFRAELRRQYHLPGQHDQETHGDRAEGAEAAPYDKELLAGYKPGVYGLDSGYPKVAHPQYGVFSVGGAGARGVGADPTHGYGGRRSHWAIYRWNNANAPAKGGLPPRKIGDERSDLFPQLFKTKREAIDHLLGWAKQQGLKEVRG